MTCREYLGRADGYCPAHPITPGGWCFEHTADRQIWEQRMTQKGWRQ